jgi:hypothetical protein
MATLGSLLVEEDRRVDQDVDRPLGAVKQRQPEIGGNVRAVGVERDELGVASGPSPRELGPEVGFLLADQSDQLPAVPRLRDASADPALRSLGVDTRRLDNRVQVDLCHSHCRS